MKNLVLVVFFSLAITGFKTAHAGSNEGVTCISKGSNQTAVWDKASGGTIKTKIKVGNSYKSGVCMGRCGAGCATNWWQRRTQAWTKDCLDHDICIADQNGQNGGPADRNCGDEFNQAADDYTSGRLRGCRG